MSNYPPLGYIEAPWFYVLGAQAWAEELSQQCWIEDVKNRLGIIEMQGDND